MSDDEKSALAKLREPFPHNQISKLPKPTKAQTEAVKHDFKKGARCQVCGTWHHPDVVHLDYVGHAAITDRLLDTDPTWTWNPVADPAGAGLPTAPGGMWITLTVCGVTRFGYGSADGKTGGDAVKEVIGDALRNAAMRFGAALDLWHKGDLHVDESEPAATAIAATESKISEAQRVELMALATPKNIDARTICEMGKIDSLKDMPAAMFENAKAWIARQKKREIGEGVKAPADDILDDDVPY